MASKQTFEKPQFFISNNWKMLRIFELKNKGKWPLIAKFIDIKMLGFFLHASLVNFGRNKQIRSQ